MERGKEGGICKWYEKVSESLNILSSLNFSVDLNNKSRYINKMKNKYKIIKLSVEEFIEKYYNKYLEEKYEDNWMDVVIEELLKDNIKIEFID